jgi:hypothetical protein
MACCDVNGSGRGGAALSIGVHCEGKGHVRVGAALSMVHCNGNGREGATLLMARCDCDGRGDAVLSMGARYDGEGSGGGGTALSIGAHCEGEGHVGVAPRC